MPISTNKKANVIYAGAGKAPINPNLAFRAKGKTIFCID
jgi:hypothetical protein